MQKLLNSHLQTVSNSTLAFNKQLENFPQARREPSMTVQAEPDQNCHRLIPIGEYYGCESRCCLIPDEDKDWDFGTGAGFYVDATQELWSQHYKMYSYLQLRIHIC
jgi:hypothetical protein